MSVVVALRAREVIGERAARRKLTLIEPLTARGIVDEARRALAAL